MDRNKLLRDFAIRKEVVHRTEFGEYVLVMREVQDAVLDSQVDVPEGATPYQFALIQISVYAFNIYCAVTDLIELGLSVPAMALHRTLFELMLQSYWLSQDPDDRVQRYAYFDTLHRWYHLKNRDRWGKAVPEELRDEIHQEICERAKYFGLMSEDEPQKSADEESCASNPEEWAIRLKNKVFGGGPTGKWHGKTVPGLIEDVAKVFPHFHPPFECPLDYLNYLYAVVYAISSDTVHGSSRATGSTTRLGNGRTTVEIGPNPSRTPEVFSTAVSFILWIFELREREFPTGLEERKEAIFSKHPGVLSGPEPSPGEPTEEDIPGP